MNMLSKMQLPITQHKSVYLSDTHHWVDSLFSDVTEDFITINQTENDFEVSIKLLVNRNNDIAQVHLYSIKNGDELRLPLSKISAQTGDAWNVSFQAENEAMLKPFSYRFKICTHSSDFFFDANGAYKYSVSNTKNFKYFHKEKTPEWLNSAVIYHIFIDRFKKILPQHAHEVLWGDFPNNNQYEFFGGDILGIIDRLDYLQDLGINTLCLTPIFTSSTNHKYDVEDYFSVDEGLGGNEAFIALSTACKTRNIKIILDGVFNHTSARSAWFNREGLHAVDGAYQNKHSQYANFFNFKSHPDTYDAFWGDKYLPKLNYHSTELRNIVYKNKNSIIKYWMQEPFAIDGWRLDACCMIGKNGNSTLNAEVLTELYTEAKISNENCYIFGENPFDPSEVAQFQHLDGITNYSGFYTPLLYWLDGAINFDVVDMDIALREFRALVGFQFSQSCKNFIGNHDKQRLFSLLNGDLQKYMTALTFLFTYVGVPSIYYGEEIGLHDVGTSDDSRICMKWDSWNNSNHTLFSFTKSLTHLYKSSKALQQGSFRTLYSENNIYVYERFFGDELVIVVLNNSDEIVDSVFVETHSLTRLTVSNFHSCLDESINIVMLGDNVVELKNISNKFPIILLSKLPA